MTTIKLVYVSAANLPKAKIKTWLSVETNGPMRNENIEKLKVGGKLDIICPGHFTVKLSIIVKKMLLFLLSKIGSHLQYE